MPVRIQSECGKIGTRITPITNNFQAVYFLESHMAMWLCKCGVSKRLNLATVGNKFNTEPSSFSHIKIANLIIEPNNDGLNVQKIC